MKTRSVNFLKNWYNINISLKKRDFVSRGPSTGYGWRLDRSVAGTDLSLLLIINIWSESPQTNLGMVKKIRIETLLIIKCSNKSSAFEDTSGYIFDHYLFSRGSSSYQPSPYIKAMGVFLYQPCHFRFSKTFCRQLRV